MLEAEEGWWASSAHHDGFCGEQHYLLCHTAPTCLSVGFTGIKIVFLAWFSWDGKAPFLKGACAWAGSSLGSKVLVQQQVTLLS